jgi:hypothetical protein
VGVTRVEDETQGEFFVLRHNARGDEAFPMMRSPRHKTRRQCGSPAGRLPLPDMDEAGGYASELKMRGGGQEFLGKGRPATGDQAGPVE